MEKQKMRLIVASNNANKLREFREIPGEQFDIVSMREAGIDADIEENGTTFEENALIKANYVMNAGNSAAIADDSGLEVDALGGEMGRAIDDTTLQSRMLNRSKGPAVHSLRAQADKREYRSA